MKMEQGMGRKGNCWESLPWVQFPDRTFFPLFRSLEHGQLNYERFRTKASAKSSVIGYLAFYNGKRSHSRLGYRSPLKFERDFCRKAV